MATTYNIEVSQGNTLDLRLIVKDSNKVPINLSGFYVRGSVRHRYSSTGTILNLSPVVVSGVSGAYYPSGFVDIVIRPVNTATLNVMQGVYDVEKYTLSGDIDFDVEKIIQGYFNVSPEVTR
jgi:hypothetical protein